MERYEVLVYPDERLFKESSIVMDDEFGTFELLNVIERMYLTMFSEDGIGLAAPQVNIHKRIIVFNVDNLKFVAINPVITFKGGKQLNMIEGCLSVPSVSGKVKRFEQINLSFKDSYGKEHHIETTGLLAQCIQHELDHLNGILYINRLSEIRKYFLLKKYLFS